MGGVGHATWGGGPGDLQPLFCCILPESSSGVLWGQRAADFAVHDSGAMG